MKQKLLNSFTWRASLLVALLSCAFSSAWGQNPFYLLDGSISGNSTSYTDVDNITLNDSTWQVQGITKITTDRPYWRIGTPGKANGTRIVSAPSEMSNETVTKIELSLGNKSSKLSVGTITLTVTANNKTIDTKTASFDNNIEFTPSQNIEWKNASYTIGFPVQTNGNNSGYFEFKYAKFYVEKKNPTFISNVTVPYGNPLTITSGKTDGKDVKTDGAITLASENTNIATVNENELVISTVSAGVTNLTINAAAGYFYNSGTETIPLTVTAPEGQSVAGTAPISVKFNASGYATFCSQYPLDFTNATDYSAWIVTGVDNGTDVLIEQVTGAVKGGTGLLLKGEPGATITLTSAASETVPSGNKLVGLLAPTYIEDGTYYGLRGKDFLKIESSAAADRIAPAGKAVLPASEVTTVPDGVKTLNLVFNDGTGIREIQTVSAEEAAEIFNLAGQRLQKAQRGVNIVNGKKVLVK